MLQVRHVVANKNCDIARDMYLHVSCFSFYNCLAMASFETFVDTHAGPTQVSLATLAGFILGSFTLGALASAIVGFAVARNSQCRRSGQDNNCVGPPVSSGTAIANMTSSDAYGMVEMPAQPHKYEYVTPKP